MLADPYPVQPWTSPCRGEVRLPGSKSLTNRALLLSALTRQTVRLRNALFSRDTQILIDCLSCLGFELQAFPDLREIVVIGRGGEIPRKSAELFVGNAGTAARFLTAFVCLHPNGAYRIDGDREMRRRPMGGLIRALEGLGAKFEFQGQTDCFPFLIETSGLRGGEWKIDASASSQMLSALMMIAPFAGSDVTLHPKGARPAFVEMTARIMKDFGATLSGSPQTGFVIPPHQAYSIGKSQYAVEPDVSAASYFLTLPFVVGGELLIHGLHENMIQGDLQYAGVLRDLGMATAENCDGWKISFPQSPSADPRTFNFAHFSDTFLSLAAVAPILPCPVRIEGIGHTRFQETDRVSAVALNLGKMGAIVREEKEAVEIRPFPRSFAPAAPALIETFKDHRLAMSFAVLGCRDILNTGKPWVHIEDPACCSKTFPDFFSQLENLHRFSHDK